MAQNILQGKRGLILGVANNRSIAWGCAQEFEAQGAELGYSFLGAAQEKRVRELVKTDGALVEPCDVSSDESLEAFFSQVKRRWDKVDFILHSIAYTDKVCLQNPFVETTRDQFSSTLDISAYSLVAVARQSLSLLAPGGSLLAMSYYGAEKVVPRYNVMGVAKAALESCVKYLAYDLGRSGIRVNAISAGPLKTLSASAIPGISSMLEAQNQYAPLKKPLVVEDVAKAACYFMSPMASGVTGEIHHVDCGYNIMGLTLPN